jgi:3-deoxy-7-phosphoheptulonate synthase
MASVNNVQNIRIKDIEIGLTAIQIIAGPCTISNYQGLYDVAYELKGMGIRMLRGGAYKMRTSRDSFRGLGKDGLDMLQRVGHELNMITVSEIIDSEHIEFMSEKIDILLVGTRSMHNYPLLEKLGKLSNPIILKRGMGSTIQEWLNAAEYIFENGNQNIILCERGIRSFEPKTRFTLDLAAIPIAHELSRFPVIIDPSHSSGDRELIKSISWGALGAGADGLMIETEINPDKAVCDASQTISTDTLREIMKPLDLFNSLWNRH